MHRTWSTPPQVNLIPPERAHVGRPQPVTVRNQDHRRAAVSVATVIAGALHQLRDFLDSEIFAGAVLSHLQVSAFPAIQRFEPWNSEIAIS
jgi:hypothetical protein